MWTNQTFPLPIGNLKLKIQIGNLKHVVVYLKPIGDLSQIDDRNPIGNLKPTCKLKPIGYLEPID